MNLSIREISKEAVRHLVLNYHYSRRAPGIKYSWGLLQGKRTVGCVIYSIPASYTLCRGVCGISYTKQVLELSRLVILTDADNAASFLVGGTLRLLPSSVVVSYADCNDNVGHVGYVYQATNWLYTGQGTAEPMWVEESTGNVVSYTRRHIDKKARDLGYAWGEGASSGPGITQRPQVGKHRYVTFTGDRRFKRDARRALRYHVVSSYPKGETTRHDVCAQEVTKVEKPEARTPGSSLFGD